MSVNFAAIAGIESFAAPVAFAVLYFVLFAFFLARAIRYPSYVHVLLTLFSAFRVGAFVLRALLSHVPADAMNESIFLAYQILYNTGFFGLVYSAYFLVLRLVHISTNPPSGPISRLLSHHFLFRIALAAAVAIGITGAVEVTTGTTANTINTGNTLRRAAIYIFLACAVLVLLQTVFLAHAEFSAGYRPSGRQIGTTHGIYFLFLISLLLVAREAFFAATATKPATQSNEALWYPLAVVTEFLAVLLFAVPGLVSCTSKE